MRGFELELRDETGRPTAARMGCTELEVRVRQAERRYDELLAQVTGESA